MNTQIINNDNDNDNSLWDNLTKKDRQFIYRNVVLPSNISNILRYILADATKKIYPSDEATDTFVESIRTSIVKEHNTTEKL